mgnify:CR=1 FL=1
MLRVEILLGFGQLFSKVCTLVLFDNGTLDRFAQIEEVGCFLMERSPPTSLWDLEEGVGLGTGSWAF